MKPLAPITNMRKLYLPNGRAFKSFITQPLRERLVSRPALVGLDYTSAPADQTRTRLIMAAEMRRVAAITRKTIGQGLPAMSSRTLKISAWAPA